MIKAIIWDMDGVLVDSEKNYDSLIVAVFREFGFEQIGLEDIRAYMGTNQKDFLKMVQEDHEVVLGEDFVARLNEEIHRYYSEVFPLVPHAKKTMQELHTSYLMGLSTSSGRKNAETVLKRHGVWNLLEASTCGSEVENGKPAPDVFLSTAEKLGVAPEHCVVIEDSRRGAQGAKDAGMKVIVRKASHNYHSEFPMADAIVEDLLLIPEIVKGW